MLDGIMWILRTGAPWRDLPERFGPCKKVYGYYSNWRRNGVFDRILEALQIRLDREGKLDWDLWCIEGAHVRAARCAAGAKKNSEQRHADEGEPPDHALGRRRGGFGSKFYFVTDGHGPPLAVKVTGGQVYEATQAQAVMEQIAIPQPLDRPRRRPGKLAGDKAYRARHIRAWLWGHGIKPVIPQEGE